MYTPRGTKLQFKIIFKEDPIPIASVQQYHIYIIQIFIYIFFRKISRKMCFKTHQLAQLTRNLGNMLQNPKYSVHSNTLSIENYLEKLSRKLFLYKK